MSDATFVEIFRRVFICVNAGIAVTRYSQPCTNGKQMVDHGFDHFPCRPGCFGFRASLGGRDQLIYLRLVPFVEV